MCRINQTSVRWRGQAQDRIAKPSLKVAINFRHRAGVSDLCFADSNSVKYFTCSPLNNSGILPSVYLRRRQPRGRNVVGEELSFRLDVSDLAQGCPHTWTGVILMSRFHSFQKCKHFHVNLFSCPPRDLFSPTRSRYTTFNEPNGEL